MEETCFVAIGAVLIILNTAEAQVPQPVAFYPLNKQFGTNDVLRRPQLTGNASSVTLTTGPFNTSDGAFEFWGNSTSHIVFPNSDGMLDVQRSISLMCWVRPGGKDGPLFQYDKRPGKWGVHIWINDGRFFNRITVADTYQFRKGITSIGRLKEGKWVHVAATYNHTTGINSIYINGILNRWHNISTDFRIAAEGIVRMGVKPKGDGNRQRFLRGAISHMEVYNVSLNANQIQAVMNKVRDGNPCDYRPCQNGGTCIQYRNSYQCICTGRYAGKNCKQARECVFYKFLNESNRAVAYNKSSRGFCDNTLLGSWYRFAGGAGNRMSESCVQRYHCGTQAPGWLNSTHPAVADGAVQTKVCFNGPSGCCEWSTNITVRNCGGFYVYNLHPTPNCSLRYCGIREVIPPQAPTIIPSSSGGIHSIYLNASESVVKVGSSIEITCTVIGGPINLNITWFKAGEMIVASHRVKVSTKERQSRLTIRNVMVQDEGEYYCQASTKKQNIRKSVTIWVLPELVIQPLIITKRVGEKASFTCNVTSRSSNAENVSLVEVTKVNGNPSAIHKVNFSITNLQIPEGQKRNVREFMCEMEYQQQIVRSKLAALIIVSPDSPECFKENLGGIVWSATPGGGMDIKPCPNGALGTATRICTEKGIWASANFTDCISVKFDKLADAMDAIAGGFESDLNAQDVLSELSSATQSIQNDSVSPHQMYGGDLVVAVDILVKISEYHTEKVTSGDAVENFAQVTSNLLDTTNSNTWKKLKKAGKDVSKILVKAMDNYGLAVAATLTGSTKTIFVRTKNLLMRIDRKTDSANLEISYNQSSIYLPFQAFSSSQDSFVVTLVFLTLNKVLSLPKEVQKDDGQTFFPDTTVISSTIKPRPPNILDKPVKIVLRNTEVKVNKSSDARSQTKCVFWRPEESEIWNTSGCRQVRSESNVDITTCECDHLTIFAALMDPYGASMSKEHQKALEIISIVGCSISLLAVLVTVAVNLFFWRVVKSPRSKVLLNLCAAIAASCTLVIFEGLARNTAGCPVVAALLHYFLLALFSWMLCEGLLHYILIVKVFGGGAGTKVRYFCLFAWGFPAILAAVSLGATQAKGYGSKTACWLDVESGLIWAFVAPALLIMLINTAVFILVIYRMMKTKYMQDKTQFQKIKAGTKASAVILPLLGLTWLFGLLGFSSDTIWFKYAFAILNSLQGLTIFVFHCVFNKEIRDALQRKRARSNTGFSSGTLKTRASPSIMRSDLVVNKLALKNRPNRAQSIDSLSLANSTPEQSPKTSQRMLSATLKKISPVRKENVSSTNSTPDQSPRTSIHLLSAHYDNVSAVDVNVVIVAHPKSSEKKQTERKRSMRTFGKKKQMSTKGKSSGGTPQKQKIEDNEDVMSSAGRLSEEAPSRKVGESLFTAGSDDGMLNQLYGKIGEENDCHDKEHFAEKEMAWRSFKPLIETTRPDNGASFEQHRRAKETADPKDGVTKTLDTKENLNVSSPNCDAPKETTPRDVQPLSNTGKTKKGKKAKRFELGQVNDGLENDENFEPEEKTWDKIRRKISGNSSKGSRHEVLSDETSENEDEHVQNSTYF